MESACDIHASAVKQVPVKYNNLVWASPNTGAFLS